MNHRGVLFAALLASAGCSSDSTPHVSWTTLAELPPGAVLDSDLVVVPVDADVGARPTVFDKDDNSCSPAAMTSGDPSVLRVTDSTRGTPVLSGMSIGDTTLTIRCGGTTILVSARVVAQLNADGAAG